MHDDPTELVWRTSSYSSGNGQCVEVAIAPGAVPVRDSKHRGGPILAFDAHTWSAFVAAVKSGPFAITG
ncbi:DUF397 domain-containing protein [Streptomyces sp. NBC_01433]|uniref:DUF397 domain-containing protein n=1 Tax=unclassified Streptomyces TaxID=2593676 RepID=UPI00225A0CCF|nr:DUF397 domain-containing protein [Streptomyces sp. NBC_01433]MCX4676553.1 DUF397 domain-containing protein [Streptomyces sp. NBC_01433]